MKDRRNHTRFNRFLRACISAALVLMLVFESASNDERLAWGAASDIAINDTTGATFASLDDAIDEASHGDKISLLKDVELHAAIEGIDKELDFDLSGHTITFKLPESGLTPETNLIEFSHSKKNVLKNGKVTVESADPIIPASSQFCLSAIMASKDTSIELRDVTVTMHHQSTDDPTHSPIIAGVGIDRGRVALTGNTSIKVRVEGNHPANVYGVYSNSVSDGNYELLTQEKETSIEVQNDTKRIQTGYIAKEANVTSLNPAYLMEFEPAEGSALHKDIQDRFMVKAKADIEGDTIGHVYGNNLYYAAPMKVNDTHYVWAFSDILPKEALGLHANVVAKKFFGQSYQDKMPQTCAIYLNAHRAVSDGVAKVSIRGAVKAKSLDGISSAISISDGIKAALKVTSKLDATGSKQPYRTVIGALNIGDLGSSKSGDGFYPTEQSRAYEVKWVQPVSQCVSDGSNVDIEDGARLSASILGDDPEPLKTLPEEEAAEPYAPNSVTTRFYHWQKLGTQTVYTYTQLTQATGADNSLVANSLVAPGSIIYHQDKVETFQGWSMRKSDRQAYAQSLPKATEDADYFAVYSQRDRKISVNFKVGGKTYSIAKDVLASKTVANAFKESSNSKKPGPNKSGNAFRGWALKPGGKRISHVVKKLMDLVAAEEPLTLYAVYYPSDKKSSDASSGIKKPISSKGAKDNSADLNSGLGASGLAGLRLTGPALKSEKASSAGTVADANEEMDMVDVAVAQKEAPSASTEVSEDINALAEEDFKDGSVCADSASAGMSENAWGFSAVIIIGTIIIGCVAWSIVRARFRDAKDEFYDPGCANGQREVCF